MSCLQTLAGIAKDCSANIAGVAKVWLMNKDAVSFTIATNQLTKLDAVESGDDLEDICFGYHFRRQTSFLESTQTKDDAIGVSYWSNNISLQFSKMESAKHLEIQAISQGELCAIVKDNNGKYWFLGQTNPVTSTEASAKTGQSYGDLNGYNITLQEISPGLPVEVSATATTGTDTNLITALEAL